MNLLEFIHHARLIELYGFDKHDSHIKLAGALAHCGWLAPFKFIEPEKTDRSLKMHAEVPVHGTDLVYKIDLNPTPDQFRLHISCDRIPSQYVETDDSDLVLLMLRKLPVLLNKTLNCGGTWLPQGLIFWLAFGEHGASSEAIVFQLTNINPDERLSHTSTPHDPDDLRRCLLLLEAVPELRESLEQMTDCSPAWARLVRQWRELEQQIEREVPTWRTQCRNAEAPVLAQLMDSILRPPATPF